MNRDIVEGNWKQFTGMLKIHWGNYTGNHFDVIAGKRLELAGQIQEDYGVTKQEADRQLRRFANCNKDFRQNL